MSQIILNQEAMPAAPVSGKAIVNIDSADSARMKMIAADGHLDILSPIGWRDRNLLLNGAFQFAQRQAAGTLTSYATATARVYGFDRWAMGIQTSSLQCAVVDSSGSPVSGLNERFYGELKQVTGAGKFAMMQVLEGKDSQVHQGRTVRFQFKAWAPAGLTNYNYRFGLLYLTASGTVDTLPATLISAYGAAGVDPTWGTNLTPIAPVLVDPNGSTTIQNNGSAGCSFTLVGGAAPVRFSATFQVPSTVLNIIPVIWSNGQLAVNDIFYISEAGLYAGSEVRDWYPRDASLELAQLQRYYWKSFAMGTAPAQGVGVATGAIQACTGKAAAVALAALWNIEFPERLRSTAPTITTYNPVSANAFGRQNGGTPGDMSAMVTTDVTDRTLNMSATGNANGAVGDPALIHVTADAEI